MLRRNCSFSPKQLGLFYVAQSTFALAVAGYFYFRGAWVISIFTAIELTVLAIALLIYARHTTDYEYIELNEGNLLLRISLLGTIREYRCNAAWVRVSQTLTDKHLILLAYQGLRWELGQYIRIDQRKKLLNELRDALRHYA